MTKIYLDANVIIDIVDDNRELHNVAVDLIDRIIDKRLELITSAHNIITTEFIIHKATKKKYFHRINDIVQILKLCSLDEHHIQNALDSTFTDFEDAVQHEIAMDNNANYIITSNKKDFKHSLIKVITPIEANKIF